MHRICFLSHVHGAKESHWDPQGQTAKRARGIKCCSFRIAKETQANWVKNMGSLHLCLFPVPTSSLLSAKHLTELDQYSMHGIVFSLFPICSWDAYLSNSKFYIMYSRTVICVSVYIYIYHHIYLRAWSHKDKSKSQPLNMQEKSRTDCAKPTDRTAHQSPNSQGAEYVWS